MHHREVDFHENVIRFYGITKRNSGKIKIKLDYFIFKLKS
jgi:hypothetical protein